MSARPHKAAEGANSAASASSVGPMAATTRGVAAGGAAEGRRDARFRPQCAFGSVGRVAFMGCQKAVQKRPYNLIHGNKVRQPVTARVCRGWLA